MKDKSMNVMEKEEKSKDEKIYKKTNLHKKNKVDENKESEKSKFRWKMDNQCETIKTLEDEDQKVIGKSLIIKENHYHRLMKRA